MPDDGKLRIICFGAHPDDCEVFAGGTACLWARQGHHVKFVSATNGDIGHWKMAGGPLAQRRRRRSKRPPRSWATRYRSRTSTTARSEPTLENRRTFTRLIREWKADIVISHRPNDYHPDHRYTGILVQDAAYMVTVPFFCPDTPALKKNPVFLYASDDFQKPNSVQARRGGVDRFGDRPKNGCDGRTGVAVHRGRLSEADPATCHATRPISRPGKTALNRVGAGSTTCRSPTAIAIC